MWIIQIILMKILSEIFLYKYKTLLSNSSFNLFLQIFNC